jgi:hypothetical protein
MLRACPHFLLARACNSLSLRPVRGRERKREKDRGREGERGGESVRKRERKREGERERGREIEYVCFISIFKRNDGCLGTF